MHTKGKRMVMVSMVESMRIQMMTLKHLQTAAMRINKARKNKKKRNLRVHKQTNFKNMNCEVCMAFGTLEKFKDEVTSDA